MYSDTVLDFAQFQLSPRKTRCELFVSGGGKTEKIASGFLKPFLTHLKVVEEQAKQSIQLINLEVEKRKNEGNWFNKGTLERFVRYVSTPEVLESVNTFDAEMSQLEGARKIYSRSSGSQHSANIGETESASAAAADLTKKELLRAIDVRLAAVKNDLETACARALSAGFSLDTVSALLLFADKFGARRLRDECTKFISLCQNRPDLITHQQTPPSSMLHQWKGIEDIKIRSSSGSDMSIDEPEVEPTPPKPPSSEPTQKPSSETMPEKKTNSPTDNMPAQPATTGSRRLSVQDRINLFESKQKEQTTSAAISSSSSNGGGVNKVVVVKGEHRRQASDASVEKSVLRRWSSTSDMSIDVTSSNNSFFSAAGTPTSSESSQAQSGSKPEVPKDTYTSLPRLGSKDNSKLSSSSSSLSFSHDQNISSRGRVCISEEKVQCSEFNNGTDTLAGSDFESETEDSTNVKDHKAYVTQFNKVTPTSFGIKGQEITQTSKNVAPTHAKDHVPSVTKFEVFAGKAEDDTTKSKVPLDSHLLLKASSEKVEGTSKQCKHQTQSNAHARSQEAVKTEETTVSHKPTNIPIEGNSNSQREQLNLGMNIPVFSVKKDKESDTQPPISTLPAQKSQVTNNELQMKADELEKLFAAHKLRVHGDQTSSSRRSKILNSGTHNSTITKQPEVVTSYQFSVEKIQSDHLGFGMEFDNNLLKKLANNLDSTNSMKQKLGGFSPSDESRGKLYTKYMQKRDEKLKEEWGSKGAQKEAQLKAMQDSLERSQAEMKAKLASSANKLNSDHAQRRAGKMRSFNVLSSRESQGQTIGFFSGEGEDVQDKSYSDTLSGNESSTSSKKLSYSKSLSSSAAKKSTPSIPKPSVKASNMNSIQHRSYGTENSLAQSVPNFSDLRKENTKPASGLTKTAPRAQSRKLVQSKSFTEETNVIRDEKSRRHSMRKTLASESSKDHLEQNVKEIENSVSKPFLKKSTGRGPGARSNKIKSKTSTNPEILKEEEDSESLIEYQENLPSIVNENEEEFDGPSADFNLEPSNFPVMISESQNLDHSITGYSKPSQEITQESPEESPWNFNAHDSFSYANETSDIDASVDSPIGSPASWSSHPLNQMMEADSARMRKKWGSAQIPVLVANAPHNTRKDVTKGFKRLLKFGRKSRGSDYLVNDWVSASTASEGDEDTEDCKELSSRNFDELGKSRMGYVVSSYDSFNDSNTFPEQVQSLRSSIPSAPANFKFREDPLSGSSLKAPRSFFSLSSFRSKANDAKPR